MKTLAALCFRLCSAFCIWSALLLTMAAAEPRVDRSVVYGMYSGLALLMDVYYPEESNGYGIVMIAGSGWHQPLGYDAKRIAVAGPVTVYGPPLLERGYTVFVLNHRMAPRFRFPAALDDVQRAVRYVRHHKERFGLRSERLGGWGGSSGGHLISLLATMEGTGDRGHRDPIERLSAKIDCAVAAAAPQDLRQMDAAFGAQTVASFLGMRLPRNAQPGQPEYDLYEQASPISHVSSDDPPLLLLHGDADEVVPYSQAERMREALKKAGAPTKLLTMHGAGHGAPQETAAKAPRYQEEVVAWYDQHLRKAPRLP